MLRNYLKIALKVLLRRKFFTFISLFAVSFTLVVLMVAVAFLDHIFGPRAPETRADRTLGIYRLDMSAPGGRGHWNGGAGYRFLDRYLRTLPDVENISFFMEAQPAYAYQHGEKIETYLKRTDGAFWQILDFTFLEGGPYSEEDEKNRNFVAVINEATRRKFFGDQTAVGKMIEIEAQRFRVVGVVANVPILRLIPFSDVWVPISTLKTNAYRDELVGDFVGLILARSAADFPEIKAEVQARLQQVEFPDPRQWNQLRGQAQTFFEFIAQQFFHDEEGRDQSLKLLLTIIAMGGLFMLLPTVNLMNINVSRIMERASEIGVRKAFGASSWTLVGQFVTENVLLTLIGGAIGFVLSRFVLQAIEASGWFPYANFDLNARIFLGALGCAIIFGLLSGVYPAWKMSRLNPVAALKGGGR
jgi:putative ABC transport system permease protein